MRILLLFVFLITTFSLIPNCAYESSNKCLSCYYGFQLISSRCDKCSEGFVMVNSICLDQVIYSQGQQQSGTQSQTNSSTSQTTSSSTIGWENQGSNNKIPVINTKNPPVQNIQAVPIIQTVSQSTNSGASTLSGVSNGVTFDINNSGVMYLLQLFGISSKIPLNCQIFTPDFKCITCLTGYTLANSASCILSTVSTSSVNNSVNTSGSTSSSTTTSSTSTGSFSSFGSSSSTSSNLQVSNGDSYCQIPNSDGSCSQCFFRYFYSNEAKRCLEVNPQCATWNKLGFCLSCYSGYIINGNICIINSQGTVNQSQTQSSNSSTQSTQTSSGGALNLRADQYCKSFSASGICSQCYSSYYYSSASGFCVPVNPQCKTWNNQGNCLSCYQGYAVSGTQCIVNFGSSSNSGSSGTGSNSSTNSTVVINTTNNGYPGSSTGSGSGSVVFNSDPNCYQAAASGGCNQCYSSFYYDSINARRCVAVNPLCRTWNNLGYCLTCYQGYYISGTACIIQAQYQQTLTVGANDLPLTNQDPYCNQYSNQVCIKCATRTYFDIISGRCLQVDANCRSWTDGGLCTQCYDGFYVQNQRECKLFYPEVASVQMKSPLNSDVNCRASDANGVCTQCIWRYALNSTNRTCLKVNDLCKTWNESNALCTGCYGGYSLTSTGECKVSW